MNVFETNRPFVKLYETSDADTPKKALGPVPGADRFLADGTDENNRLRGTLEGETEPLWWISQDHVELAADNPQPVDFSQIVDGEFFEDAHLAARALTGFLDAGGMSVEYLLLLAWSETGWKNTDALGRDGQDADLEGQVGPFLFAKFTWAGLLNDSSYNEVLRGFTEASRLAPHAQCFFAATYANKLQRALRKNAPDVDPPAWLLRLGHRIGDRALVRFAQLGDADAMSTKVNNVTAVSTTTVNANPKLFPNKSDTTRSEVKAAIIAEFETAKRSVENRLGSLVQDSVMDGMIKGSSPSIRKGALGLLDFIAKYESGGNYNAVVDRAKNENQPNLVSMTISQIQAYQHSLGGRNACGKYQIVKGTLAAYYEKAGLSASDLFNADGQDKVAYYLLMAVRKGQDFLDSDRSQARFKEFALAVAQEWAALPVLEAMTGHRNVPLQRGDSYYKGTAGNRALVDADTYEAALKKFINES